LVKFSLSAKPLSGAIVVPVVTSGYASVCFGKADVDKDVLRRAARDGFTGRAGDAMFVDSANGARFLLAGAGTSGDASLRRAAAGALRKSRVAGETRISFLLPGASPVADEIREIVESVGLAAYRFDRHKSRPSLDKPAPEIIIVCPDPKSSTSLNALRRAEAAVGAVTFARDLINEPPSKKTPETIARIAGKLAKGSVKTKVFHKAELIRMKADALLGVNRGSAHPPVLLHLHYKPSGKPKRRIALVGKGITFDSGGLSLKPADGMMTMKYDMAGSAAVLGIFSILPFLKPDVEIHGVAPVTENMPGPDAYKPGDVVRAMNGTTIEVLNTDAEGRIVLADALSYAAKLPVDEILDVATLTGAATIALGRSIAAVMTTDDGMMSRLQNAASSAGEKVWRLPLESDYKSHIKSKVADIKNIGNPGEAGTIIGGLFLQEFVGGKPWVHIDMAAVGWSKEDTPFGPAGSTGSPIRTILNFILD
jgi:leucyl aminopeptidase